MVGDYIQLRDTINSNVYESLSKKGWPKRVDSISKCNNSELIMLFLIMVLILNKVAMM